MNNLEAMKWMYENHPKTVMGENGVRYHYHYLLASFQEQIDNVWTDAGGNSSLYVRPMEFGWEKEEKDLIERRLKIIEKVERRLEITEKIEDLLRELKATI